MRALGVIDLPTIQKKLNLHYTLSLDLFGSEVSTNAANSFNAGLKGRYRETQIEDDHRLEHATYPVLKLVDGAIRQVDEPALTASICGCATITPPIALRAATLEQGHHHGRHQL